MSTITTHVLDTTAGKPAAGIPIVLEYCTPAGWREIGRGATDADGRLRTLVPAAHQLQAGTYRLTFDTSARSEFYPRVVVEFAVHDTAQHYHVPLLLSPFGYSTYRGS